MSQKKYTNYFRSLAQRHRYIRHNPASETQDVSIGEKRFARWSTDEVLNGMRTKISFPALLIEPYEAILNSENAYSIRSKNTGAFTVLVSAPSSDYNKIEDAYDLAEEIVYDLLAQMWQDHYGADSDKCTSPFYALQFEGMEIIPVGPLYNGEYGYRCEFKHIINNKEITTAPAAGVFINP